MEMSTVSFAVVAATLAVFSSVAYADDFTKAYNKIEKAKTNINYNSFCKEIAEGGEEKLACRIKGITSIGFLVCKKMKPDGVTPCLEVIENEVRNLVTIVREGINTVDLSPKPNQRIITGVKCGEEKSGECSGFLEKWVSRDIGEFQHIRDSIVANKVGSADCWGDYVHDLRPEKHRSWSGQDQKLHDKREILPGLWPSGVFPEKGRFQSKWCSRDQANWFQRKMLWWRTDNRRSSRSFGSDDWCVQNGMISRSIVKSRTLK